MNEKNIPASARSWRRYIYALSKSIVAIFIGARFFKETEAVLNLT